MFGVRVDHHYPCPQCRRGRGVPYAIAVRPASDRSGESKGREATLSSRAWLARAGGATNRSWLAPDSTLTVGSWNARAAEARCVFAPVGTASSWAVLGIRGVAGRDSSLRRNAEPGRSPTGQSFPLLSWRESPHHQPQPQPQPRRQSPVDQLRPPPDLRRMPGDGSLRLALPGSLP
jgi:hypothetical protein